MDRGAWQPTVLGVTNAKVKSLSHTQLFATPWIVACTKLLHPRDFQGKNTGVGCHFLLQGIFPTQGSNPGLLRCRQILYQLSCEGSPILGILGLIIKYLMDNESQASHS